MTAPVPSDGISLKSTKTDSLKAAMRAVVVVGWTVAVVGVGIFTYAEAYPRVGQQPRRVGSLTLSQFGFWLMVGGIGLVAAAVIISNIRALLAKSARKEALANAVHAGSATGHEDQENGRVEEAFPLIGSERINYGSVSQSKGGPFTFTRTATVVTARSPTFSKDELTKN